MKSRAFVARFAIVIESESYPRVAMHTGQVNRPRWLIIIGCLLLLAPANNVGGKMAALGIGWYQRFLSPWKGYRCAYARVYSADSCSEYGRRAVREAGLARGFLMIAQRLQDCQQAGERAPAHGLLAAAAGTLHATSRGNSAVAAAPPSNERNGGGYRFVIESADALLGDYIDLFLLLLLLVVGVTLSSWPAMLMMIALRPLALIHRKDEPVRGPYRILVWSACAVCVGLCALVIKPYYAALPPLDYVTQAGWRQQALAEIDRTHASEADCRLNGRNCSTYFYHSFLPPYRGEDHWSELRPFLHFNVIAQARLERWVIEKRLDPSPKASQVAEPAMATCSNAFKQSGFIVGLPAIVLRPVVWTLWSLLVAASGLLSPFVISLVAAPIFTVRFSRNARYLPFVAPFCHYFGLLWGSLINKFRQ